MIPKTQNDYRIELVKREKLNGKQVKVFNAFEKIDGAFVFIGQFAAPTRTPNRTFWRIAAGAQGADTLSIERS